MSKYSLTRRGVLKAGLAAGATLAMPSIIRAQSSEPIVIWTFEGIIGESKWQQQFIDEFTAQTGYKVELVSRAWANTRQDLLAAIAGGDVPDLFRGHGELIAELGAFDVLQPLDELPGFAEAAAEFVPNYLGLMEYNGQHLGFPIGGGASVLAGNKPMMEAASIDPVLKTYEAFKEDLVRVSDPDKEVYGLVVPVGGSLDAAFRFAAFLYKAGGRVLNDDWSAPIFNSEAGVRALEYWVDLHKERLMPPGIASYAWAESTQYWALNKAAFAIEGSYWAGAVSMMHNFPVENVQYMHIPTPSTPGDYPSIDLGEVHTFSMFKGSKNPEGAWELMKFLRNSRTDVYFAENELTTLPVTTAAYADNVTWKFPGREIFKEAAATAQNWPTHPNVTEIQTKVGEAVAAAITGTMTAREALDAAAHDVVDIIS